jgi:hypothetical protein
MHEPDRERCPARTRTVRVWVRMKPELTVAPANEEADGEVDEDDSDRALRRLLNPLRKKAVEEDDRKPEGEQRRCVAEAPGEPELAGAATGMLPPLATSVVTAAR